MTTPIPQPRAIPFLGNVTSVESEVPLRSFRLLTQQYGDIYQLNILGTTIVHCNSYSLLHEISDEHRFRKVVSGPLYNVRALVGDGLFTAHLEEPNWGMAHRILMPAFGPANIRNMFDDMTDVASQLTLKWERFGPDHIFEPTEDYTRLTLDTIALCSMSYRINSFYSATPQPFVQAMGDILSESFRRFLRPSIVNTVMRSAAAKYEADIKLMQDVAQGIIDNRKANPTQKKDLLSLMLEGKDPQSGESLPEKNIMHNLLTFLVAGHETTSGMLSFTTYYLLKTPNAMRRLRQEIDEVCGDRPVKLDDLSHMPYLTAVMRESLRLAPTASQRQVVPNEDTTLGNGKWAVKKDTTIVMHILDIHRDPRIWGDDAEKFVPERMLDGKFEALPPHAWQPFGFGLRGCIGRAFAWQEAQLVLASVFQKFDLFLADPSYTLEYKQTLTIKPLAMKCRAVVRPGRAGLHFTPVTNTVTSAGQDAVNTGGESTKKGGQPLYVLYGSNTGTCEAFAQKLASAASEHGFKASMATLDSAMSRLPTDGPVLIVTASFEGEPADNAARFFGWLESLPVTSSLKGVSFAVFGCGNREWAQTYQRIPRLIDENLASHGAERLVDRGEADASTATFFQDFEEYEAKLWGSLSSRFQVLAPETGDSSFTMEVVHTGTARATLLRQPDVALGEVVENRVLTKPGVPMKRHIEFSLPEGMSYRAGDYLTILPTNPPETVRRAIARFKLSAEQEIVITSKAPTTFPIDKPITIQQLLGGYVELTQPATTRDLEALKAASKQESTKAALAKLLDNYQEGVLAKRISVLDVLEDYLDIDLPLTTFFKLLPAMRIRQYSISSSPLVNPQHATLTVSVINAPALSGRSEHFLGVGSNYLADLKPGDRVQISVRPSSAVFHPPSDPLVPAVMFCAGSGIAPFRGFIQERVAQKESGREVGKTLLFFGCRSPDEDYLYSNSDLAQWVSAGVLDVRPSFSRKTELSEGCKYVQHRILHDHEDISAAYAAGAKFYTCGSRKASNGIREACLDIIKMKNPGLSDADALLKWQVVQKERYATDIFD